MYFFSALWYAFVFFWVTNIIFYDVANTNLLYATIWNTALIIGLVVLEKGEEYVYAKIKPKNDSIKVGFVKRIVLAYFGGASFKTSLYLFYSVMLVCNALVTADPDFPFLRYMTDYFMSVYYGILILFAVDTFLSRLLNDIRVNQWQKHIDDVETLSIIDNTQGDDISNEPTKEQDIEREK